MWGDIFNDVIQYLMNHKSIRKFKEKSIECSLLETLITAETSSAININFKHLSIILVDDKEKLSELGISNAPLDF